MEIGTILVAFFSFLFCYIFLGNQKKYPKNFPPGPKSYIPLVGGLIYAAPDPPKYFLQLRKKWGDIFSFDMGPKRIIILNSYKVIREALALMEFNGHPQDRAFRLKMADEKAHGILLNEGKSWYENRKFTEKCLRQFGFGTKAMEPLVEMDVNELIDTLLESNGKPILIENQFNRPVVNSLWAITTNTRLEKNDTRIELLFKRMTEDVETIYILFFYPWLFTLAEYLPAWVLGNKISRYISNSKYTLGMMNQLIKEHKETYDQNNERDFIDKYLTAIQNETDPNSSFYKDEGEKNLETIMHDFFMAGSETTSSAINWSVHILAINPEIQDKVHQEIKSVIGLTRIPNLNDRPLMPYTTAFILEIQRYSSSPPSAPHEIFADINFRGFHFPKGTFLMINLYACLHDPDYWGDPQVFSPERFLNSENKIINHEAFLPFSSGMKRCLGESLGKDSMFLFITSICQRFKIYPDPELKKVPEKIEYLSTAVNTPISFPIIFQDRYL